MWQTKDEIKCENLKWKMWWYEELNEFMSAYSDTLYDKHKIKTSWADDKQARLKFQGVSPVERSN